MLAGEVTAVEANESRARELEENVGRLGAENVRVVHADGRELPPELRDFDRALVDAPCSGLGVLAARPDLRWRSQPLPELQLELLQAAAARVRPGGTIVYSVCTHQRGRVGSGRRRLRPGGRADRGVGAVPASDPAGVPPDPAARPPHERLLHRPAARIRSLRVVARLGADGRDRAVALRGGLLAARRPDRAPPACRGPHLPLRHRRRALRPAGDDRPGRAALDRSPHPRPRRPDRLPPDGRRPGAPLPGARRVGRGQRHLPCRGRRRRRRRDRAGARARARGRHRLQPGNGGRSWPPRRPTGAPTSASACRSSPATPGRSSWRTRTSGSRGRAQLVDCFVQVDGGVKAENVRAAHDAGADLLVVGTGIFGLR